MTVDIFTIGFTKKTAEMFFKGLREAGVKRVIDTRLNNVSQLAGFPKKADLEFFLREVAGIEYLHLPALAPTQEMLTEYKSGGEWKTYESRFIGLMRERKIEETCTPEMLNEACLLCSEATPHHCHRRLVAEYLKEKWKKARVEITHL